MEQERSNKTLMQHEPYYIAHRLQNYYINPEYISIFLIQEPNLELLINGQFIKTEDKCVILTGSLRELKVLNNVVPVKSYLVQIDAVQFNMDFTDLYLNNILIDHFDNYYVLSLSDPQVFFQIEGTLMEITKEYDKREMLNSKMIKLLTERFFIKFLRYYVPSKQMEELPYKHHIIVEFIKLVNLHFKSKKKLSEYAELLNVSIKTLSNIFSASEILTPSQIIKQRIVKEAKTMALNNFQISGKEIAYKLGYQNPNNFFVLFRNKEGVSFSEYQKKYLG